MTGGPVGAAATAARATCPASAGDTGGPVRDVLVLRALGLGDTLAGVAALRGARRAWPGARLWLAGPEGPGEWLRSLGVVDAVIPTQGLDAPIAWEGRGHLALDLHGRGPQSHRLLAATRPQHLVAFGCTGFAWRAPDGRSWHGPPWDPHEHEVDRWCRLLRWAGGECGPADLRLAAGDLGAGDGAVRPRPRDVLLHPGAASASRRWPPERWAAVAAALADAGWQVCLTGDAAERGLCEQIVATAQDLRRHGEPDGAPGVRVLAGALDVPALVRRVAGAGLLICGDTGVAHVATAVGTPSVLLFGPTPPSQWGPAIDRERHRVLWHGTPGLRGDPHGTSLDPALGRICAGEVLDAVGELLGPAETERLRPPSGGSGRTTRRSVPALPPR